jgi:hypothetical protein
MFLVQKVSRQLCSGFQNRLQGFQVKFWKASGFILRSPFFPACVSFGKVMFLKSASRFLAKVFATSVQAVLSGSFFLAK